MTDDQSCSINSKVPDLSQVEIVNLHPENGVSDYQQAVDLAKREAEKRFDEYMLVSWYDRDRDFESPQHASECHLESAVPGFFHDPSVEEVDLALGVDGIAGIMGHHADRRPITVQLAQQVHDGVAVVRIQVSGRLICQQDGRLSNQCARHSDSLLLASGELRRIMAHAMHHSNTLERLLHRFLALG